MKKKTKIKLPSDQAIADKMTNDLAAMQSVTGNKAIFASVSKREREALKVALDRAQQCAENVRISLKRA